MPNVTDFIVDKATVRIGDEPDAPEIVYRPSLLSADRTDDFFDALNANDVLAAAYLLTGYGDDDELIVSWTLKYSEKEPLMGRRPKTGEDGEPMKDERGRPVKERYEAVPAGRVIPLDPDILRFLTPNFLMGIYQLIQEDSARLTSSFFGKTTKPSLNGSRSRS